MDPEIALYHQHTQDQLPVAPTGPPPAPFVPPALPSPLRPTLSPSVSRVFQRPSNDQAPKMQGGLDLSQPRSPYGGGGGGAGSYGGGGTSLDEDTSRLRPDGASRLAHSPPSDPRDTASAKDNIAALVAQGQRAGGGSGSTPSLASFMGSGARGPRVHKINQGMTPEEKEETEKLEKEMAATRAKWGSKAEAAPGPPVGGLSLADLMRGGKTASKPASPPAASSIPSGAPQSFIDSSSSPSAVQALPPAVPAPTSPPLVEAKVVTRSPPISETSSATSLPPTTTNFTSPRLASGAADTLTRLRSSSIVAERLKWGEEQSAAAPSPTHSVPSSPELSRTSNGEKRRSVLDRWGRDSPNEAGEGLRSPPLKQEKSVETTQLQQEKDASIADESATVAVAKVEDVDLPKAVVEADVTPKLVHATQGRARPTKTTARTQSAVSTSAEPSHTSSTPPISKPDEPSQLPSSSATQEKKGYSKPVWTAPPIGSKPVHSSTLPSPSPTSASFPDEPTAYEPRHVRGVALPGLASATPPVLRSTHTPSRAASIPPPAPASTQTSEEAPSGGARASVRAAAMRWGAAPSAAEAAEKERERQLAVKASYGVRVDAPSSPVLSRFPTRSPEVENKPTFARYEGTKKEEGKPAPAAAPPSTVPVSAPAPTSVAQVLPAASRPLSSQPSVSTASSSTPAKSASPFNPKTSSTAASSLLALLSSAPPPSHLPPGETLSLSVFHLNSPSLSSGSAIEHNFLLFRTEILGIVHTSLLEGGGGKEETSVWVWRGDEAVETEKTRERIGRLEERTGVRPVEVRFGKEPPALAEAFAGQVTICKGDRDHFDHLEKRLYSIRSEDDGVVYVEEVVLAAASISSGHCNAFSSAGEVFAFLGDGSTEAERHACCEFAESIADGRDVTVFAEEETSAYFWHLLDDGLDYASAYYWRYRPSHPSSRVSVLRFDSPSATSLPSLIPSLDLSPTDVSLIDGDFAENWIVVPAGAKGKKEELRRALEAAKELSEAWEERGFAARTAYHVIVFPSLIPRDVPFLSRKLDLEALNAGELPTRMNVFTAEEAAEELL